MVVKVLPSVAGMVVRVRNIPLVNTFDTSGTSIPTLPEACEYLVVLDLAQRVALTKIAALASTTLTTSGIMPVPPILAPVTYMNASGTMVTPISIGVIPSPPVYTTIALPGTVIAASSAFDAAMADQDVELAQTQVAKLNQGMAQYQTAIQENLGQFNKDLEKFKAETQKIIEQSHLLEQEAEENAKLATDVAMQNAIQTAQTALANNTFLIQKYQAMVSGYAQGIQAEVGVYGINQSRISVERDRLLALINQFRQEYYDTLSTKFNVNLTKDKGGK